MIDKIRTSNCPSNIQHLFESLLEKRKIVKKQTKAPKTQTRCCPQGSCSGPALWNLVTDEALSATYPENTCIQAFADDFIVVAAAESESGLGKLATEALNIFKDWSDRHGLSISVDNARFLQVCKLKRGPPPSFGKIDELKGQM
ncbi:hypothetical protein AVEN_272176-1 [Araneus ventricosus]|uniref:Reverse transcriptase domain-containing protein n=1 Tax=Araneus ventricosus TaxID=182803 RepID=A0A4Y2HWM3_ARAVE|nr:hypothetical protein AVEN_272176-1 [Araneus ventricosus]